jgi:uncharacterized protein (TIGR02246 family)
MKPNLRAASLAQILLLAAAGALSGQRVPGAPPIDWERESAEYRVEVLKAYNDLMTEWRHAWEGADARRAADFYAETAVLVVPDSAPIQGKQRIQEYFVNALPKVLEIRTGLSDFVASDRLAYALSPVWYREKNTSGAERAFTGTCMTVLVREGRRWKIRSQIFRFQPA